MHATASADVNSASTSDPALPAGPTDAHWAAVMSLTLGCFGLVTAEFLPASLLTGMARDLQVSVGAAGQTVTTTAVVGAIAAPLLPLLTQRFDRRQVVIVYTLMLLVSNAITLFAQSLGVLLLARVLLGVALSGFWSMAAALAMRLVPPTQMARAVSLIYSGISLATVLAAPLGAWMGEQWGWRSAFMAAGAISVLALAVQLFSLPSLPPIDRPNLRAMLGLLKRPSMRTALITVLLMVTGHFAGFTYVRPLLEQVTELPALYLSPVLLGYGLAGFAGNALGGRLAQVRASRAVLCAGLLIAGLQLALLLGAQWMPLAVTAVVLWGLAFSLLPVGVQTWVVRAAPDQAESAGGVIVATFQVAIASGALFGGLLVDHGGPLAATAFAMVSVALGALVCWRRAGAD